MPPPASIEHRLPGRVRIRIESRKRDADYFTRVAEQLRQCPSVLEVRAAPLTGGILILHEAGNVDVIVAYAKAMDLFDVVPAGVQPGSDVYPDQIFRSSLHGVDRWMRQQSKGGADLRSVAVLGLLATAVWQAARGALLPAGGTLLWYALTLSRERTPYVHDEDTDVHAPTEVNAK